MKGNLGEIWEGPEHRTASVPVELGCIIPHVDVTQKLSNPILGILWQLHPLIWWNTDSIVGPSPLSGRWRMNWKFQASNHGSFFLSTSPAPGSHPVTSFKQKMLLWIRKLQGFQEPCGRNQDQRSNIRTKDVSSIFWLRNYKGFRSSVPGTSGRDHFVVQLLSHVQFFATSWTAVHQASLSFTISWSLLKLTSIESVMPSNRLILYRPLLLLPSAFPSICSRGTWFILFINLNE